MKMIVEEHEFIEALKEHFKDKIVIKPNQTFNISYKAGRKGNGLTVFLEIIEDSSVIVTYPNIETYVDSLNEVLDEDQLEMDFETVETVDSTHSTETNEESKEEEDFILNTNSSLFTTEDQSEEEIDEELDEIDEEESSTAVNLFGN